MAVREVKVQWVLPLDPHKKILRFLPKPFYENEPDRVKVLALWAHFKDCANKLGRARCSLAGNLHIKKKVFQSGMENLCNEFSRPTVNIKIHFDVMGDGESYLLRVVKLTDVPDMRAGRSVPVKSPLPEIEADPAELLAYGEGDHHPMEMVPVELLYNPTSTVIHYLREDDPREEVLVFSEVMR